MSRLRLIPLDDTVVFPGMTLTLPIDTGDDREVFLVPRHGSDYAKVGTVARVVEEVELAGRGHAIVLTGVHRGLAGAAQAEPDGTLRVEVEPRPDVTPPRSRTETLETEYRAVVEEILDLRGADDRIRTFVRAINEPGPLADTSGYAPI